MRRNQELLAAAHDLIKLYYSCYAYCQPFLLPAAGRKHLPNVC